MATNTCSGGCLSKVMNTMDNLLKTLKNDVNTADAKNTLELVNKYDVVLSNDVEEQDLIPKYETFYDQLSESIINKMREIGRVEVQIKRFLGSIDGSEFEIVLSKKKENANKLIGCNNRIVERIKELETIIYNNRIKELDNMKVSSYIVNNKQTQHTAVAQHQNDYVMDTIKNSMNVLMQWSNKNHFSVIFDSNIDGNGCNNVLFNKVINKSNLYFIVFDDVDNNIFGGYIGSEINKYRDVSEKRKDDNSLYRYNNSISDNRAFVFSLTRNGIVKNQRYFIKPNEAGSAFTLFKSYDDGKLYAFGRFGYDISIWCVGVNKSISYQNNYCNYDFKNENNVLTDVVHKGKYPSKRKDTFSVARIVVLEMK